MYLIQIRIRRDVVDEVDLPQLVALENIAHAIKQKLSGCVGTIGK